MHAYEPVDCGQSNLDFSHPLVMIIVVALLSLITMRIYVYVEMESTQNTMRCLRFGYIVNL
jgi:hypothetical protein